MTRHVVEPWIRPGFLPRLQTYLAEMFPVWRHLFLAALLYLSSAGLLRRIHDLPLGLLRTSTLVGICSVFSLLLMLRLMDELKDKEIDRALFPHRPLPSGQVLEADIRLALGAVIALYLAVNLLISGALWSALGVLGYALLMFRYFGIPRVLRKYLLLNLATHNPIVPIILLHLLVLLTGYAVVVWGHARFWVRPNPVTSRLRPFAESYSVLFLFAHLLEHGRLI